MHETRKRKTEDTSSDRAKKKPKQWRVPRKGQTATDVATTAIIPGEAGIWVTCNRGQEAKCTAEAREFFNEQANAIYGIPSGDGDLEGEDDKKPGVEADIEQEIRSEITGIERTRRDALFQPVRIDVQCVLFFRTRAPVEPATFVHKICTQALNATNSRKPLRIMRLTPMTRMGKANEKGLEDVSKVVLEPHFHAEGVTSKKVRNRQTKSYVWLSGLDLCKA
ncbi:MAG: hypothetical protein Q9191_000888 [Dirinaria sp. TL-2023a]